MPRSHPWLWFLASGFACALSVDDPPGEPPSAGDATPPVGNPFGNSSFGNRPIAMGGTAGSSARGVELEPDEAGGGGGDDPDRAGQIGEPRSPFDLLGPDAAAPQCPTDAGACDDALCLSNDDCRAGLCVNARCRSFCEADNDCPEGQACALGLCRTSPGETWECFVAVDCLAGEDCVSGGCLQRCANDGHCADSDDGAICSFGYCGP
jgi:hypothetical protein